LLLTTRTKKGGVLTGYCLYSYKIDQHFGIDKERSCFNRTPLILDEVIYQHFVMFCTTLKNLYQHRECTVRYFCLFEMLWNCSV